MIIFRVIFDLIFKSFKNEIKNDPKMGQKLLLWTTLLTLLSPLDWLKGCVCYIFLLFMLEADDVKALTLAGLFYNIVFYVSLHIHHMRFLFFFSSRYVTQHPPPLRGCNLKEPWQTSNRFISSVMFLELGLPHNEVTRHMVHNYYTPWHTGFASFSLICL